MIEQLPMDAAPPGSVIQRDWGVDQDTFGQVLEVRRRVHGRATVYDFDHYSAHYLLTRWSQPVGCLTVTHAVDGPVDCRRFYPDALFDEFGDRLVSACKSNIIAGESSPGDWRRFTRTVWRDLLTRDVRIDVINVRHDRRDAFRAMGYVVIGGCRFGHPTLNTDSVGMFLSVDPDHRSLFRSVFREHLGDVLEIDRVESALHGETSDRRSAVTS